MTRQIYKISLQLANFLHTISRIAGKVHFSFALFQRKNKYPTLPEAAIPSRHHRGGLCHSVWAFAGGYLRFDGLRSIVGTYSDICAPRGSFHVYGHQRLNLEEFKLQIIVKKKWFENQPNGIWNLIGHLPCLVLRA